MGNQGNKGKSKKQDKFEKDEKKEQQKKRAEGSDMEEKQIETELIRETGAISLERNKQHHRIELLTIIGEIEGHDVLSGNTKATKYEHIIPKLAQIEDSCETDGVLIILNTMGGDVEAGLAIAEMIASLVSRRYPLYWEADIRSVFQSRCRLIIPLLWKVQQWSSIRSV